MATKYKAKFASIISILDGTSTKYTNVLWKRWKKEMTSRFHLPMAARRDKGKEKLVFWYRATKSPHSRDDILSYFVIYQARRELSPRREIKSNFMFLSIFGRDISRIMKLIH